MALDLTCYVPSRDEDMSVYVESRKMQRARRRRRRLIVTMLLVLILVFLCISAGVKAVAKLMEREEESGDAGGYITEQVLRSKDHEAPVIEGVKELTVSIGDSVSYKRGITVTDNRNKEVPLIVDTSQVDLDREGDYPVTYIARDSSGNIARVATVIHVKKPKSENATEEMLNVRADEILEEITVPGMSQYEEAEAIFNWVHENIAWSDHTPKQGWMQGAYMGLVEKKGDCYVYAMASKCLLTRAGIKNMDIEKIPTSTEHYWNLIDLGGGWYHFDATRRADKTSFFYTSDAELMEYSRNHGNSHNYDPSQYPKIQ